MSDRAANVFMEIATKRQSFSFLYIREKDPQKQRDLSNFTQSFTEEPRLEFRDPITDKEIEAH